MRHFLIALVLFSSATVSALPLQTWPDWVATAPYVSKQVPPYAMVVRGIGTTNYYVLEVDPTTGALPVSGSFSFSDPSVGPTGSPVPAEASYTGLRDPSGDLIGANGDASGNTVVVGSGVAGTPAGGVVTVQGDAAGTPLPMVGIGTAGTPAGGVLTVQGDAAGDPLPIDGTVEASNFPTTVTTGNGTIDANTLRTATVLTDGTDTAAIEANGALRIEGQILNFPNPVDVNLGTPGASTVRTAAMLGVGSAAVSNSNPVPISDAGGTITVDGTVAATQSGQWDITDITGTVSLPTGAATEATLASIDGKDFATETTLSSVLTAVQNIESNSGGKSYADSVRNVYSSTSVTTVAWVQLIASVADDIDGITLFDSSGQTLELGIGAATAETRLLIIPPGGLDGFIPVAIAAGTRLSVRAISGTASTGELNITGYSNP